MSPRRRLPGVRVRSRQTGARPGVRPSVSRTDVPEATVARLPVYLRALDALADDGVDTVSSDVLASAAGVGSAMLRKDLSHLGSYGTRGVGYEVEPLRATIARETGSARDWPVVVVGIGNLGQALAGYGGFASRGFSVRALLDSDPARVGERVGDLVVRPVCDLERVVAELGSCIGVITTPASAAQGVADRFVRAGVRSILNFAPAVLDVPAAVEVREVDLSVELQILAYHEQRRAAGRLPAARATAPRAESAVVPEVVVSA